MADGPYRVVRVPVWGRADCYSVAGRPAMERAKPKVPTFKSEAAAIKLRDRMNADYQRYQWAVWASKVNAEFWDKRSA